MKSIVMEERDCQDFLYCPSGFFVYYRSIIKNSKRRCAYQNRYSKRDQET